MGLWSWQSWKMVSSNKGTMISWREQQMGMVMSSLIIFIILLGSVLYRFRLCVRLVSLPWFCFSSFVLCFFFSLRSSLFSVFIFVPSAALPFLFCVCSVLALHVWLGKFTRACNSCCIIWIDSSLFFLLKVNRYIYIDFIYDLIW